MVDYDYDTYREVMDSALKTMMELIDELEKDKKERDDDQDN